jgi:hypothetical protein
MQSEWMKVMLEEVARKREEAARAREEQARRAAESRAASPRKGGSREPSRPAA